MSFARPYMQSMNGKSNISPRMQQQHHQQQQQEPTSPSHQDDLINYINESWNKVSREFEHFNQNGAENSKSGARVRYFNEQSTNPELKDFEPFDLDKWWGKRLVQNITHRSQAS